MAADLDRAKYHKEMMTNYVAKIEKSSKDFWSNWFYSFSRQTEHFSESRHFSVTQQIE